MEKLDTLMLVIIFFCTFIIGYYIPKNPLIIKDIDYINIPFNIEEKYETLLFQTYENKTDGWNCVNYSLSLLHKLRAENYSADLICGYGNEIGHAWIKLTLYLDPTWGLIMQNKYKQYDTFVDCNEKFGVSNG